MLVKGNSDEKADNIYIIILESWLQLFEDDNDIILLNVLHIFNSFFKRICKISSYFCVVNWYTY